MQVFGIVGYKNNGKTTLIVRLIEHLVTIGLKVSTIKHAHHQFDLDQPGKDSHRHREAGAREVMVATSRRWMLVKELRDAPEPELDTLVARMEPVDLLLVEGFKRHDHPKLEVHRAERGTALLAASDPAIVAVATDAAGLAVAVPVLHLDDIGGIARLILRTTGLARHG